MRLYCPLIALLLIICSSLATAVTEADAGLIKRASLLDSITSFVGNAFGSGRSQESSGSASGTPAASSNAPGVSKDILDLYAAYAGAAYNISDMWNCGAECNHPGTEGTVVEWRWDTSLISSDGYIARNPQNKVIVASFRGSVDLGDWAESFTAELVPWPASVKGSLVAGGFLSGYAEASEKVTSQVANLAAKYPDHSLVATGHSLGGSRASFFVADMSIKHPELVQRLRLFTYGQAKGCNRVFANMMDGMGIPVFREVYKGDIAPHLPFTDPDYVHFGTEAWVNDQGITFCKSSDTSNCSERLPPIEYNIPDHTKYPGL